MDEVRIAPGPGPRGAISIIADTFRTYGRNIGQMVIIAALVLIPLLLAGRAAFGPDFMALLLGIADDAGLHLSDRVMAGIAVYGLLYLLGVLAVGGALAEAGARSLAGSAIAIGRAYGVAIRRLPSMLGATLITAFAAGIPIGLAMTMATVPTAASIVLLSLIAVFAVYVFVRLMFAMFVALLEQAGPLAAVSRSWALVSGAWWRTFGLLLLLSVLVGGVQLALEIVGAAVPELGAVLATIIATPLTVLGNLLIYLDLRARKQRYSTEQLGAELEALALSSPPAANPPSY